MNIVNVGSLNIDHVYRVSHIVRPGETLASTAYRVFAGGKGANQSVALARAGGRVAHVGRVGAEGRWLMEKLAGEGVDISRIIVGGEPTGHAMIQVDEQGQNSIVLLAGANRCLSAGEVGAALDASPRGSMLLLQNEVNDVASWMEAGRARGMRVCFNPAPFGPEVAGYPLELVDVIVVNETEGAGLTGEKEAGAILEGLSRRLPRAEVILTRGGEGVMCRSEGRVLELPAERVRAVDTTAAGDTFIGYFLAMRSAGRGVEESLRMAVRAAAVCVSRPGAMDSIPRLGELSAGD